MKFKNVIWLGLAFLLGIGISLQSSVFADKNPKKVSDKLPLAELQTFSQIFYNIKKNYVEGVDDKDLINNAIAGMVSGLDPHSSYLLAEDFSDLKVNTEGQFGGLGIEVGMEDGFVKVISPIDDTPAAKAGVKAGDLIIRLDKTSVKGMTLNDAVKIMRGKVGEPITITIVREGEGKPLEVKIVRDIIKIKSVRQRILEPGFGYVRISQFQEQTHKSLKKAIDKLVSENENQKLEGLVLDLRNNPGGILDSAVDVSDAFLTKGLIVYTEGRTPRSKIEFKATKDDLIDGVPIVVLINNGSASASEIVAGALQDHKRAIIIGTKSFGKGSVQTVLPMQDGAALKITTARYFTPSGNSIQAKGIIPDIEVKQIDIKETKDEQKFDSVLEADLTGHLVNPKDEKKGNKPDNKIKNKTKDSKKPVKKDTKDKDAKDKPAKDKNENLIKDDFVLYEALNLLKALHLL